MKKTIICSIPMKKDVAKSIYTSTDLSLASSERAVKYPINAFLEKTISAEDEIKFVLLTKEDAYSFSGENVEFFKEEIFEINKNIGAKVTFSTINTAFSQEQTVHEQLLSEIIDEIDVETHVLADITYGPKDMPIVLFSALEFAEKFLKCDVDNIIYGQANFENGKVINTKICDMIPLFYLNSVTDTIKCEEPEKAKSMLKALLAL